MSKVFGLPGLDPSLPDVVLLAGGEEYHLCFDMNAIVLAEKATGIDLFKASISNPTAENLRGLLWACILKDCPDFTIEQAGALITPRNLQNVWLAVLTAWHDSVKSDEDEGEDAKPGEAPAQVPAA